MSDHLIFRKEGRLHFVYKHENYHLEVLIKDVPEKARESIIQTQTLERMSILLQDLATQIEAET